MPLLPRLIPRLIALAAALGGCGPSVIWSGRTADRRHRVELIEDAGLQYVVIDGRRRIAHRGIAAGSIAWSEDGHLAFAARAGGAWVVVRDGVAGESWDAVGELVLWRGGRLAYAAGRAGRWHVVIDGAAGPAVDALGPLEVSADGAHVAYAARRGADAHVVIDGRIGPRWSAVAKLALAPAGGRAAYAALDRDGWHVVLDGAPGPAVGGVRRIAFSDDGRRVAWIARVGERDVLVLDGAPVADARALRPSAVSFRPSTAPAPGDGPGLVHVAPAGDDGEQVIVDGVPGPAYREIATPIWSRDGRLAYAARRAGGWVLVVDGRELPGSAADAVGDPVFSPDGRRLAYLARRGRTAIAMVDGREHQFELAIAGSLAFSADGRRWAVIAGEPARGALFFAIEDAGGGVRRVPLAAAEVSTAVRHPSVSLLEDGLGPGAEDREILRAWSRAEADRAALAGAAL